MSGKNTGMSCGLLVRGEPFASQTGYFRSNRPDYMMGY